MGDNNKKKKWEAKVSATVKKATADQIFPLFADFFNLHRFFPNLAASHGVSGQNGVVGCVRLCSGFSLPSPAGASTVSWSKERLLAVDRDDRSLTYEMVDGNIGFRGYVSTVRIVPAEGGGCVIEWGFRVDPVEGWAEDDLVGRYEVGLGLMAKNMEEYVLGLGLGLGQSLGV